ncbi:MAG: MBL fold metallo-hydrolase [Armatimonadetes bacterium CG06_land_8_20_14_3_00_66_21]|nr:MAG: MBL fold metallo-hydrolase [Armatimonadetes bacterium CG06_land_8_20_14_3_00_66_21]PIX38812.1 MAG: MBL fold metallo-hydrolase [Armatimonadetes bacterium CG_4_8_14_3_um_filter_66_20]
MLTVPTFLTTCAVVVALAAGLCASAHAEQGKDAAAVTIRWWGQACTSFTTPDGKCVLVDPFPADFGYASPTAEPQVCLVTHEHADHNSVSNVKGKPEVVRGAGAHEAAGLVFAGVATFHDDQQGAKRGPNTVYVWQMAGLRLAHLGDLGHLLTQEQLREIGKVDVVLVPVGGFYTIDAKQAVEVIRQLSAKIAIPMHYKTKALSRLPIAPRDDFLKAVPDDWAVERPAATSATLSLAALPAAGVKVIVLNYE